MLDNSLYKKPICVDIIENSSICRAEFNPISDDGKTLIYSKVVNFLSRRGYIFDQRFSNYYKLELDGIYYPSDLHTIKNEIYTLVRVNRPTFNVESKHVASILSEFQAESNLLYLDKKFYEFLATEKGIEYDFDYIQKQNGYQLIPVLNGLFNPCWESDGYPFTLLPHCGYYFPPEGTNTYDLEFVPIPESEIYTKFEYEDFLTILGDKETVTFFLWWAGAVLFSYPFRLPIFVLLYGRGGTGKTSLANCLLSILGKSGGTAGLSSLIDNRSKACLIGKKLNLSSEMEGKYDKRLLSSIKDITGGTSITVDPKFKPTIEISPPALIFTGNVFPEVDTSDTGVMRRACVINCSTDLEDTGIDWPLLMSDNEHKNWLFNASYYVWSKYRNSTPYSMKSKSMLDIETRMSLFNPFSNWVDSQFETIDKKLVGKKIVGWTLSDLYERYYSHVYDMFGKPMSKYKFSEKVQNDFNLKLAPVGNKRVFKLKDDMD